MRLVRGRRNRINPLGGGYLGRHRTIYRKLRRLPILGDGVRLGLDLELYWFGGWIRGVDLDLAPVISWSEDKIAEDVPFG
jgi:hypothetical protein